MIQTNLFLLMIFLLLPLSMRSQEDICIGKQYTLYATSLQEERTYWVHLPDGYAQDTAQTYPVIYLLDGESFFHSMVGICRTLLTTKGNLLPPCIIVGILSTDRTRDFTPTASAANRSVKTERNVSPQGGGSQFFLRFLTKELRTTIDSSYRTNGQNMLLGHSYAGLFTLYAFLNHPEWFDVYIAADPSLWWDNGRLALEAQSLIADKDFTGKSLYMAFATRKRTDRKDIHLNTAMRFVNEVMPQAHGLHFITKKFPEENHGSVSIPAFYDGIKQLFSK